MRYQMFANSHSISRVHRFISRISVDVHAFFNHPSSTEPQSTLDKTRVDDFDFQLQRGLYTRGCLGLAGPPGTPGGRGRAKKGFLPSSTVGIRASVRRGAADQTRMADPDSMASDHPEIHNL